MSTTIHITNANTSHLNDILEIENLSFDADKFNKRQFRYLMAKNLFFVAMLDEKVVGYVILLQSIRISKMRLYSIAVHPKARKNHVGQQLLDYAIKVMRKYSKKGMYLEVRKSNQRAIQFYKKNGFVVKHIKKQYYVDGEDALSMVLTE